MTIINYPRHFAYLGLGAIAVYAVLRLHVAHGDSIFLALNGLLHAAAVAFALNGAAAWLRRAVFAAIATVSSYAAFNAGAVLLPSAVSRYVGFCFASAIGAAAYWFLVRAFWIRKLKAFSLLRTVILCAAVTWVWGIAAHHSIFLAIDPITITIHTLCWWLAFSFSLYLSERAASA